MRTSRCSSCRSSTRDIIDYLGLIPQAVIERGWIWQPATYMFLHADPFHILFNMLGRLDVRRRARAAVGHEFFARYYAITGIGAGVTAIAPRCCRSTRLRATYGAVTIGASGALYGLLLAFAMYFPDRPILMFFVFPVPAKYFVMIIGALAFLSRPAARSRTPPTSAACFSATSTCKSRHGGGGGLTR